MVFNGLQKSELLIFNALTSLPRKTFYLSDIECLTGYTQRTIANALHRLQENGYIAYHKNSRSSPYSFEIKDKAHVVFYA